MSGRRRPAPGTLVYLGMALFVAAGIGLACTAQWRLGITITGVALAVAGGVRAVIPERMVGLLRVRRRASDAVALIGLGVALVLLVAVVPMPDL